MAKIDRPRQSKFMGHVYKILWVSSPKTDDGDEAYGTTENDKCKIEINDGLPASRERETILHEMLHQLLDGTTIDENMEEYICTNLGSRLAAHIDANPLFWRYVTRRLPKEKS